MLSFLFIGVGGSGGETVRYTMRELDRQLRRAGWESGIPDAWQFMHVDVRQKPDDIKADIPASLRDRLRHVPLTAFPLSFTECANSLAENPAARPGLAGWWPDPNAPQTKIYEGAGQRRAVGRITALARMSEFDRPLRDAIAALSSGDAREELDRLSEHLLAPARGIDEVPARVVVVSSLGGGSGSGTFLDIIQYLRATGVGDGLDWLTNAIAVLYAPDVFDSGPEQARKGVEGNSLAALSELVSSYLLGEQDPMDPSQAALLSAAGGAGNLRGNTGPAATMLIGKSNGKVDYGRAEDVFQVVGKTLATFAFESNIQGKFDAFVGSNWAESSPGARIPILEAERPNPASSFGYASVSLGRSLFAEYAAERLANRALVRLRSGHKEADPGRHVRDETLIAARADAYEPAVFLPSSGLWELGPDRNQVLDALRGVGLPARLDELQRSFLSKEISGTELHADEWLASFTNTFNGIAEKFTGQERLAREKRAQDWVASSQLTLVDCVVDSIARNGMPVTLELLRRLDAQIEQAQQHLLLETEQYTKRAASFLQAVGATFASLTGRARRRLRGDPDAATFTESARHRRSALADRLEIDLRELAGHLLEDLRKNLLPGLAAAVGEMARSLEQDLEQPEVTKAVGQWSQESVASHLMPTPNEFLLEKVEDFPNILEDLLRAQTEAPLQEAMSEVVEAILRGGWISATAPAGGPQTLIDISQGRRWVPNVQVVLAPDAVPQSATFSAFLTAEDVLARARDWVRQATGPIKDHVDESLASWLDAAPSTRTARGNLLVRNIDSALAAARPLIGLNSRVLRDVHGLGKLGASVAISPIPILDSRDPARVKIAKSLMQAGVEEATANGSFGENPSDSVEIVSFLGAAVHPIVFSSFATPIQKAWTTRGSTADGVASFWAFKRARPLTSFVPLSPTLQRTVVRGWMTARLLNLLTPLDNWDKAPVQLRGPSGLLPFPRRLLSPPRNEAELLPSILESLPVAMIAYASGQGAELDAYFELIRLGAEGRSLPPGTAQSHALQSWILKGECAIPGGAKALPSPLAEIAGTAGQSAQERAEALLAAMTDVAEEMAALDALELGRGELHDIDRMYEIRDVVAVAAAELSQTIGGLIAASADAPVRRSKAL